MCCHLTDLEPRDGSPMPADDLPERVQCRVCGAGFVAVAGFGGGWCYELDRGSGVVAAASDRGVAVGTRGAA